MFKAILKCLEPFQGKIWFLKKFFVKFFKAETRYETPECCADDGSNDGNAVLSKRARKGQKTSYFFPDLFQEFDFSIPLS